MDATSYSEAILSETSLRLEEFASTVPKPFACLDDYRVRRVFFGRPSVRHYMVLSMARSISGMRAALSLYRGGFYLESMTLLRSVVENQSHLNYVCAGIGPRSVDRISREFVAKYFSDTVRKIGERAPHSSLQQKEIHKRIALAFKEGQKAFLEPLGIAQPDLDERTLSETLSRLYNIFSNYLHGRYPEMMTLFGYENCQLELSGTTGWQDPRIDEELFGELSSIILKDMKLCVLKALAIEPQLSMPAGLRSWAFAGVI